MASIRIPCLVAKTNKARITSWYWQPSKTLAAAGWKPLTLGKDEGRAIAAARARNEEVEQWKAGGPKPEVVERRRNPGTVDALIKAYRRDVLHGTNPVTGKPRLSPKTVEGYKTGLDRIEAWAGQHPIAYVTPARVIALRNAIARPPEQGGLGHSAAFNLLKTLRQLFAYAESADVIPKGSNPATDFGLGAPAPRAALWEADDEAAFIAAAYALGLPSLALAIELAIYTGQREGDLIAMTEAQVKPLMILDPVIRAHFASADDHVLGWEMTQGKNRTTQMAIPFEPALRKQVETAIRTNRARDRAADPQRLLTHVLVDDRTGLPWKKRQFIAAWRSVIEHAAKAAHRPTMNALVWHDLRRTRVVRLRRQGIDPAMIASITGHSPQSINMMLKVYGPIDPTITAAAIAGSLPRAAAPAAAPATEQSA